MHPIIAEMEKKQLKQDIPEFSSGDKVRVHLKIKEGDKERIQIFEGIVLRRKGGATAATFTVRKVSYGVGVERIFPLHSPMIDKIEVVTVGDVRQSRIYYLRDLRGKKARIKEKREA
jgi:large subunit ribosomal protein L19